VTYTSTGDQNRTAKELRVRIFTQFRRKYVKRNFVFPTEESKKKYDKTHDKRILFLG